MLETLLVIPLYLVLIGGTLWIGDLILSRQRLVGADRYGAWNAANRHRNSPNLRKEIQDHLFEKDTQDLNLQTVFNPRIRPKKDRQVWWHERKARVPFRIRMPPLTSGWIAAGDAVWDVRAKQKSRRAATLYGRYSKRDRPGDHDILMRSPFSTTDYFRNWQGRYLCNVGTAIKNVRTDFLRISFESWPPLALLQVKTKPRPDGAAFPRHGPYRDFGAPNP